MEIRLVGVDCAVQPTKTGVALAEWDGERGTVLRALKGGANQRPADVISAWHREENLSLIALDAPLGWPAELGARLANHTAGSSMPGEANPYFRRYTDEAIHKRLGKQPLDVGANFIARTAKAALDLLDDLRQHTAQEIPLAWEPKVPETLAAIEVYPAGTLRSLNLPIVSYKAETDGRREILDHLPDWFDVSAVRTNCLESADVLDSVLCVLAGIEFCAGRAVPPDNLNLAQKEGWIWTGPAPAAP